jgi:hypothetical protein
LKGLGFHFLDDNNFFRMPHNEPDIMSKYPLIYDPHNCGVQIEIEQIIIYFNNVCNTIFKKNY